MKLKLYSFISALLICSNMLADNEPWQNPQVNEINREPMHAHFIPFTNEANALKQHSLPADVRFNVNPATERRISLDGTWKFLFSKNNELCPKDFHKPGYNTRKWSKIQVPGSWELQGFDAPIYTDTRYPFPANPPHVPADYNPVGAYIREFTVPGGWEGMDIFLDFEGVESAYYVWVNGELAGYAEDSRLPSHFNITKLLKKGSNKLAVKVFRYSDGSYLEGQDYWKYSGIERDVYLYARPQSRVRDFRMTAELINDYKDGELNLDVILHQPKAGETVEVKVLDAGKVIYNQKKTVSSPTDTLFSQQQIFPDARAWNAETPNTYTLVVSTFDAQGKPLESFTQLFGFRTVEMRNGMQMINGKAVLFKGVNRHEHDPHKGRTISVASMIHDIQLMKQFNLNAVRTCHYPNRYEWYALCNEYGLYLVDEANIESHGMQAHKDGTLANNPDWEVPFMQRMSRMVLRDRNITAIVTWSMGNESGYGKHFETLYDWTKKFDPTRPVQYEGGGYDAKSDIYCPMYARVWALRRHVNQRDARPMILCEYAHAMGNSEGGFKEYWDLIRKYPKYQGGYIWDFVDQGLRDKSPVTGKEIFTYGGDYGRYPGSDYNFNCNGIIAPNRRLNPHAYEIQYVLQNVWIKEFDAENGSFNVYNENFFKNIDDLSLTATLFANGVKLTTVAIPDTKGIAPQATKLVKSEALKSAIEKAEAEHATEEITINFAFASDGSQPLVDKGQVMARQQIVLNGYEFDKVDAPANTGSKIEVEETNSYVKVSAERMSVTIGKKTGMIDYLDVDGEPMLKFRESMTPEFWRAPTDNDYGASLQKKMRVWKNPQMNLKSFDKSESKDSVVLTANFEMPEVKAELMLRYRINAAGEVAVTEKMTTDKEAKVADLFRYGMLLQMPASFSKLEYYGRGPEENYIDRHSSSFIGKYEANVKDEYYPYVRPQESGNHTDIRYFSIFNPTTGKGITFEGYAPMECSAIPYLVEDLDAGIEKEHAWGQHSGDLVEKGLVQLHIQQRQFGLGCIDSWGSSPMEKYRMHYQDRCFSFVIKAKK